MACTHTLQEGPLQQALVTASEDGVVKEWVLGEEGGLARCTGECVFIQLLYLLLCHTGKHQCSHSLVSVLTTAVQLGLKYTSHSFINHFLF